MPGQVTEQQRAVTREATLPSAFRAVVIEAPGKASLQERPLPEVGPQDVLIKVAYNGTCATDLEIFKGELGYFSNGLGTYPIVPGHEFSGVIARTGQHLDGLEEGMPVVVECIQTCGRCEHCDHENWIGCRERKEVGVLGRDGGYAEYVVVPGRFVHVLPAHTDLRKAALCEPMAVVLKGIRRLERGLGSTKKKQCAVVGAGPIGHLCARMLAMRGHRVHVFDEIPGRLAHFRGSDIEASTDLKGLNHFDGIIEATGNKAVLQTIMTGSRPGSVLLLLGLPYGLQQFNFEELVGYDKTVIGSVGSTAADFRKAIHLLPRLDLTPLLLKTVPLERYQEAWNLFNTRNFLKVMIAANPS